MYHFSLERVIHNLYCIISHVYPVESLEKPSSIEMWNESGNFQVFLLSPLFPLSHSWLAMQFYWPVMDHPWGDMWARWVGCLHGVFNVPPFLKIVLISKLLAIKILKLCLLFTNQFLVTSKHLLLSSYNHTLFMHILIFFCIVWYWVPSHHMI